MRRSITLGILAAFELITAFPAAADQDQGIFSPFGYSKTINTQPACVVDAVLDRATFIQSVPQLKSMDILNSDYVTQTVINMQPNSLSLAFITNLLPLTIRELFDGHRDVRTCKFRNYVNVTDDYGHDQKLLAFSFVFTRALFEKVNWDHIDGAKIPKISIDFKFGADFQQALLSERS